jgi:hypothetical protein
MRPQSSHLFAQRVQLAGLHARQHGTIHPICQAYLLTLPKRLKIDRDLYAILQILSVSPFEKVPLFQLLTDTIDPIDADTPRKQLILFDF